VPSRSLRVVGPPSDRGADREITAAGIALALGFLALAALSLALPPAARRGTWLPLHLALAGGATTAIAAAMPFFVAALAAAPPAPARLRVGAIVLVALGAAAVAAGVPAGFTPFGAAGGLAFLAGVAALAGAMLLPLRRALGPSRGIVMAAYALALMDVATGTGLATLGLAGWTPVVEGWGAGRPAHAWLNLFGFVTLVIAGTMLHLYPTVVGARIARRRSAFIAVAALAAGAPLAAAGYLIRLDTAVIAGALAMTGGAGALAAYALATWRSRARWTTDAGWHRFTSGALSSAIGWLVIAALVAATRAVSAGADSAGWTVEPFLGPLVAGWVGVALLGSATHLLPAIGPGDQVRHARQRALLGRWSAVRLVLLDGGIAFASLGLLTGWGALAIAGAVVAGAGLAATLLLVVLAVGRA
jgi:nitrite reductase (NO-forming)